MLIKKYINNNFNSNTYLLHRNNNNNVWIIDPGDSCDKIIEWIEDENKILSDGHLTAYFAYKSSKEQDARNHLFVANMYDQENVKKSLAKIDNSDYQSIQNLSMK